MSDELLHNLKTEDYTQNSLSDIGEYTRDKINTYWEFFIPHIYEDAYVYENEIQPDSLFDFITNHIDYLNENAESGEYPDEKVIPIEQDVYRYWNPSINVLYDIFDEYLNDDSSIQNIIGTVGNADAAVRFWFPRSGEGNPILLPLENLNQQTYYSQRGYNTDENNFGDDLTNHGLSRTWNENDNTRANNIQTTRERVEQSQSEVIKKWLRLIMPKYSRHVEIEDLNRNFWVIGLVLSKMLDAIFLTTPYKDLLRGIIEELSQLWENVLHLWINLALLNQKEKYNDFHVEFIPLPIDKFQPYQKFDGFDDFGDSENLNNLKTSILNNSSYDVILENISLAATDIIERLDYLVDKYSNNQLCIIPYIRLNNYNHNYFYTVLFPCICSYNELNEEDEDLGKWRFTTLSYKKVAAEEREMPMQPCIIDIFGRYGSFNFIDYLWGIKEFEDGQCSFGSPIEQIDVTEDTKGNYFALIRFTPSIEVLNDNTELNLSITLTDGAKFSAKNVEKVLGNFNFEGIDITDSGSFCGTGNFDSEHQEFEDIALTQQENGFYCGELVSAEVNTVPPIFDDLNVKILKIGDFYPVEYTLKDVKVPFHGPFQIYNKRQNDTNTIPYGIPDGVGLKGMHSDNNFNTKVYCPIENGTVHLLDVEIPSGLSLSFRPERGDHSLTHSICIRDNNEDEAQRRYYFIGNLENLPNLSLGQQVNYNTLIGSLYSNNVCIYCVAIMSDNQYISLPTESAGFPNQYGMFAHERYTFKPNTLSVPAPQASDQYTYGVGSYSLNTENGVKAYRNSYLNVLNSGTKTYVDHVISNIDVNGNQGVGAGQIKFVQYNLKNMGTDDNPRYDFNNTDFNFWTVSDLTSENLKNWGVSYAKQCILANEGWAEENHFFLTKIGLNYWTGANGPQWSHGITCHLLVYDKDTKEVTVLGKAMLFDGYWTNNTTVFSFDGTQWRRLGISGRIKKKTRHHGELITSEYSFDNGTFTWSDHNVAGSTGGYDALKVSIPIKLDPETRTTIVRDTGRECEIAPSVIWNYSGNGGIADNTGAANIEEWYRAAMRWVNDNNDSPVIRSDTSVKYTCARYLPNYGLLPIGIIILNPVDGTSLTNPIPRSVGFANEAEAYQYFYNTDTAIYWRNHDWWTGLDGDR